MLDEAPTALDLFARSVRLPSLDNLAVEITR